ncbi:MAG TPA: response regulator transcription factor [Symbiobacteriaceae bacterium]|jgi:DNA-binding response OmpR family regulator|nr:response regulator transcription factor [Symbiobacteriaceae bacterium]
MSRQVLVVDDEPNIRELCRLYLEQEGFTVEEAADGIEGLERAKQLRPALVVLDLMMPGKSGFDVCRELRSLDIPVIMLTARGDEVDKILGLELGADDYLTKPFSPRELVARVKVVLRRSERGAAPAAEQPQLQERLSFADFTLDLAGRTLVVRGKQVDCPPKEFDLLAMLAQNPHRAFTREQLLEKVWDYSFYGDYRTVDVHVQRIRKKIEPDAEKPRYVKTVWGVGYKFEPAQE